MPNTDDHDLIQQIRALAPDQGGQVPAIARDGLYKREADPPKSLRQRLSKATWPSLLPLNPWHRARASQVAELVRVKRAW